MRIGIVCNDTRGGVEPYVALALALTARGFEVSAVAPAGLSAMFADHGIAVADLPATHDAADFLNTGLAERGTISSLATMRRELPGRLEQWVRATVAACTGCDLLLGGIGGMATGLLAGELLRLPWLPAHLQPLDRPTTRYPGAMLPVPDWSGPAARLASHWVTTAMMRLPFRAATARVRRTLALDGRFNPTHGQPTLYGFSSHVVPLPQDADHIVTGYWRLPASLLPPLPEGLLAFLDRPGPTIGIGFGSMGSADPAATGALVAGAVRDIGVRAVIWGDAIKIDSTDDIFAVRAVPHARLFGRLAAIVHHGGAGTTGAAFSAGRPQVVVPFVVDQPFWASRVVALGCGPAPIARRRLARSTLAAAIVRALEPATVARAGAVGARLAADDGNAAAVAAVVRWAGRRAP